MSRQLPNEDPACEAYKTWLKAARETAAGIPGIPSGWSGAAWGPLAYQVIVATPQKWEENLNALDAAQRQTYATHIVALRDVHRGVTGHQRTASKNTTWIKRACERGSLPTAPTARDEHGNSLYPDVRDAIRASLKTTLTRLVPTPPDDVDEDYRDIRDLIDHLAERRQQQQTEHARLPSQKTLAKQREQESLVATNGGPCLARDLNPEALNLGSTLYAGGVPPYVPREVDTPIAGKLATGMVVVCGDPKSGKTRTLVNTLQHDFPDATVWWARADVGAIQRLTDHLHAHAAALDDRRRGARERRTQHAAQPKPIVVLDDAQAYGTHTQTGLSAVLLRQLSQYAQIAITIHRKDLEKWTASTEDHRTPNRTDSSASLAGIGLVSHDLITILNSARVDLNSELTDQEMSDAADILQDCPGLERDAAGAAILPSDSRRLAEWLSAIKALTTRAGKRGSNPYRAAIVDAAIDAHTISPLGVTTDTLTQLTQWRYHTINPTQPWEKKTYNKARKWASKPIGGAGSPTAIITHNHHTKTWKLFDALHARLTPHTPTTTHLTPHAEHLTAEAKFDLGWLAREAGDAVGGLWWGVKAAKLGEPRAMFLLRRWARDAAMFDTFHDTYSGGAYPGEVGQGSALVWRNRAILELSFQMAPRRRLALEAGDVPEARVWEGAAILDLSNEMFSQGSVAHEDVDVNEARRWWEGAAILNNADAMFSLGRLAREAGDVSGAREWVREAARRGHAGAMLKCADLGDADAMFNLGVWAREEGDLDEARRWWVKAASNGHVDAMFYLAVLARDARNAVEAREWFIRAAESRDERAMVMLGVLAREEGDEDEARRWWVRAADKKHAGAMLLIGLSAHVKGDVAGAREWIVNAAQLGHADAMFNLGELEREADDLPAARNWFERACRAGHDAARKALEDLEIS